MGNNPDQNEWGRFPAHQADRKISVLLELVRLLARQAVREAFLARDKAEVS